MQKSRPTPPHVAERAATRYTTNKDGCWESTYAVSTSGHSNISWYDNGKGCGTTVHRAAWVYHNSQQIPEDSTIVQTCGNKTCVHPDHLKDEKKKRKTQCDKGHGPQNWRKSGKGYRCRECRREAYRKRREQRRLENDEWALKNAQPKSFCVSTGCLNPRRQHERPNDPPGLCEYHYDMAMNQPKLRAEGVAA